MFKIICNILLFLVASQIAYANVGKFFNITESGVAADLDFTLCLDANAEFSCQKYHTKHQTLNISTVMPNHIYKYAGIKVHTSGYSISPSGCTMNTKGFCVFSSSKDMAVAISVTSVNAVSIPLTNCEEDMFCISLGGPTFNNQILPVRFDTGAGTLSIPESCLSNGTYTVIAQNVQDQFQQLSDLVQANVSLMDGSTQAITLDNFLFYATKNTACSIGDGSYGNFGAGMNYVIDSTYMSCVSSYFNYVTALNKPTTAYGFTVQNGQSVLVGPINAMPAYYQQVADPGIQCNNGVLKGIPSYSSHALDQAWPGPLVDNFAITIDGIPVPVTESNTSQPQPTTKLAQIDSGGGLMIISDNSTGSIISALNSVLSSDCSAVSWLAGCECVVPGKTVVVSSDKYGLSYQYQTAAYNSDLKATVAVCPPPGTGSPPNPYVSPNSANLGYQLFAHGSVVFNYQNGQIGFSGFN